MAEVTEATLHGYLDLAGIPRDRPLGERVLTLVTQAALMIPEHEIIDAAAIRELAGIRNRRTLQAWRESKGFPEPFAEMSGHIELWDARKVRTWLEENR